MIAFYLKVFSKYFSNNFSISLSFSFFGLWLKFCLVINHTFVSIEDLRAAKYARQGRWFRGGNWKLSTCCPGSPQSSEVQTFSTYQNLKRNYHICIIYRISSHCIVHLYICRAHTYFVLSLLVFICADKQNKVLSKQKNGRAKAPKNNKMLQQTKTRVEFNWKTAKNSLSKI